MTEKNPNFEIVNHTADLGMLVRGKDLQDLFVSAATALAGLLARRNSNKPPTQVPISLEGEDLTDTFVRWLGEILYLFNGEGLIFTGVSKFTLSPPRYVEAIVLAAPYDPEKDEIVHEIKAVTYHQASVSQVSDRWEARVIFDL